MEAISKAVHTFNPSISRTEAWGSVSSSPAWSIEHFSIIVRATQRNPFLGGEKETEERNVEPCSTSIAGDVELNTVQSLSPKYADMHNYV